MPSPSLHHVLAAVVALPFLASAQPPVFTQQPATQQISNNSTVVFSVVAPGATSFQWRKGTTPIASATGATLVIFGATNADAGAYSVVATNATASTTSLAANLNIAVGNDFGRLSNLSVLTDLTAATTDFTLGTVIGGLNTTTTISKPLVIRAVGPSLAELGVPGALADARLELFAGLTAIASNDDWQGTPALKAAFGQVGAFPLAGDDSKDAAIVTSLTPRAGGYTVRVSGAPGATGRVIAELYDATGVTAFPPSTPRLINVSVLKQVDAGATLTAGFVIGGSTAKTVLVRAVGPGLGAFGVPGVMADPQLGLFRDSVSIATNDNWGGDAQLTQAGARVGAFKLESPQSADAMLLITLQPGNYSAQVGGVTGGGAVLVEVYEVP